MCVPYGAPYNCDFWTAYNEIRLNEMLLTSILVILNLNSKLLALFRFVFFFIKYLTTIHLSGGDQW